MSNEQSAMSVEDFPPLPEPSPLSYRSSKNRMIKLGMFSADQMHGYLLADRAARGQAAAAWDNDTTQRLRSIVALLGLDYCVPDGDLTGHEFAVLDFVRREIERLKAAAPVALSDTTQSMLDMLGRYHPYERMEQGEEFKAMTDRFLNYATDFQQPLPVPDQAAVVWRGHLIQWRMELAWLRSVKKSYSGVLKRAEAAEAALSQILAAATQPTDVDKRDAGLLALLEKHWTGNWFKAVTKQEAADINAAIAASAKEAK